MLGLTIHHYALYRAARLVHEAFDARAEAHVDAQLGRTGRGRRDQSLVAAAQAAHPLAGAALLAGRAHPVGTRPQVGRGKL